MDKLQKPTTDVIRLLLLGEQESSRSSIALSRWNGTRHTDRFRDRCCLAMQKQKPAGGDSWEAHFEGAKSSRQSTVALGIGTTGMVRSALHGE